jgi:hypothetical protein
MSCSIKGSYKWHNCVTTTNVKYTMTHLKYYKPVLYKRVAEAQLNKSLN